jgi:hypothetical protein
MTDKEEIQLMRRHVRLLFSLVSLFALSTPVTAGEITGPPPTGNYENTPGTISNGNSFCSYSGLNDTPDGVPNPRPEFDPGGQVQSYGYFMSQFGLYDPSNPSQRDSFTFPGFGCNPNRGGGLHG